MTTEQRLLQQAAQEIRNLRNQNQLMSARLDTFDSMMRLFHTSPNWGNGGAMSPDIVWEIESLLKDQKEA